MELKRMDYAILKLLNKNGCKSHFESMTLQEIMNVINTSRPTTYRKMMTLCKMGLTKKGCKSTLADTFYLSEKGSALVENKGGIEND